jgi:hypothetical protein
MTILKDFNLVTDLPFRGAPAVILDKYKVLRLNTTLTKKLRLKKGHHCFLYYREEKTIAFKFVMNPQPFSLKVNVQIRGGRQEFRISLKGFLNKIKYVPKKANLRCAFQIHDPEHVLLVKLP